MLRQALLLVRSGVAAGDLLARLDPYIAAVWPGCRVTAQPGEPPGLIVAGAEGSMILFPGAEVPTTQGFDSTQRWAAAAFCEALAEAEARTALFHQVLRSNAWLARLDDLSRAISRQPDVASIIAATAAGLGDLFGVEHLGLYQAEGGQAVLVAWHGSADAFPSPAQLLGSGGRSLLGEADDSPLELGTSVGPGGAHRLASLLHGQEGLEGILVAVRPGQAGGWDDDAIPLVHAAAGHLATAVRNARLMEEMRRLAAYDDLTGLAGRRHFMTELDREFDRARRESRSLSLLMVDADHFKGINDNFGHGGGDQVLLALADQLKKNTRTLDVVGRLGGEEFGVLLPGADAQIAQLVAERLRKSVSRLEIAWREGVIRVTVSVGAATWDRVCSPAGLLEIADQALYAAKDGGRNRVVSQVTMDVVDALNMGGRD